MRRISSRSYLVLASLTLAACTDDDVSGPSSIVETVAVIPGVFSLVVDDTLRLTTIARGEIGNPLVGRPVLWETSSPSVATVSETGLVTAVGAGAVNITATIEGKVGTATVTVSPHFAAAAFVSITAGGSHTCAQTSSGVAYCWGRGTQGQLGVQPPVTTCPEATACALVPFPVDGGLKFERLSAGVAHTCGLTSDGSAWCWGDNGFGQLGDGSLSTRNTPVAVATTERFTRIAAGHAHTCALTEGGAAWCWGENQRGELGDGTTQRRLTPVQVAAPAGVSFQQIAPGSDNFRGFTCALATTGAAWCWGANDRGQLGRGTRDIPLRSNPQPEPVSGSLTFASLTAGFGDHVCGLTSSGAAYCWGGGTAGELGDGLEANSWLPLQIPGMSFVQLISAGESPDFGFTCGLTSGGAAYCWGNNTFGVIGDGTTGGHRTRPVAVTGNQHFASLSGGWAHACGRTIGGIVYCWGANGAGQLGTNSTSRSTLPVKVVGQP